MTSECMKKPVSVKPLHSIRSFQSTRGGWTQTKHLRRTPCKSDHELLQETSKMKIGQICTHGLLHWKRSRLYSRLQQITSRHSQSCTSTCHVHTFMHKSSETCAGTVTNGGQNDAGEMGLLKKSIVRHTGRSKQVGA